MVLSHSLVFFKTKKMMVTQVWYFIPEQVFACRNSFRATECSFRSPCSSSWPCRGSPASSLPPTTDLSTSASSATCVMRWAVTWRSTKKSITVRNNYLYNLYCHIFPSIKWAKKCNLLKWISISTFRFPLSLTWKTYLKGTWDSPGPSIHIWKWLFDSGNLAQSSVEGQE